MFDFCFGVFLLSLQWRCVVCFSMYDSVKNYLCIFIDSMPVSDTHTRRHTHKQAHKHAHTHTHTLYLRGKCGESWWDLLWYEESCEHIVPCWEGSCNYTERRVRLFNTTLLNNAGEIWQRSSKELNLVCLSHQWPLSPTFVGVYLTESLPPVYIFVTR